MRSKLKNKLQKLDSFVSWSLDRVLPRNLTSRYLLGLGVMATLAIVGQLLIQLSLTRQIEIQDQIRFLDGRIPLVESLRKNVLVLQLSSSSREMQRQAAAIQVLASQISFEASVTALPADRENPLQALRYEISQSTEELHAKLSRSPFKAYAGSHRSKIASIADKLISLTLKAEQSLKQNVKYLEQEHINRVKHFKKIELILTFITLCILVLEALYVFRPAVSRLYDALRVRSDFLSRMSHEIRNPMNSIIGMANLLSETPINDQQKRYISILRKSSRGLLDMLNGLLDFSSLESGKLKLEKISFDLYDLIERTMDMAVVGAHANGIELVLDLDSNVPLKLVGDPSRLFQVLTNLLGNAVKFTKRGQVTLRVQSSRDEARPLITFSVIDTGVGIEKTKLETIFDPFVQEDSSVKRRFGGTGLGLSIAKQLVERMGGKLSAKSVKDEGSEFTFAIAFECNEPHSVSKFISEHPVRPFKATLIENNAAIAEMIKHLIVSAGGTCAALEDKSKLLETLLISEDNHLVILDYESVKSEMTSLLPILTKRDLDTSHLIILLKTTALPVDLETLGRVGVKNLLFKPVKPIPFFEALLASLDDQPETHKNPSERPEGIHEDTHEIRPLTILVCDDSQDNQMLIELYLQATPHKLVFASDGRIALQKFKEGRFDLVFMDLQMPEMDGYDATRAIRKWEYTLKLAPVPIIAISAHDSTHDSDRFNSCGFTAHLVKPIDAMTLRRAVIEHTSRPLQQAPHFNLADDSVAQIEMQIAKLAPSYLENRKKEIIDLRRFADSSDFKSIQVIGHRLKGNAKSYGFPALAQMGAELEIAARDQDLQKSRALIEKAAQFVSSVTQN